MKPLHHLALAALTAATSITPISAKPSPAPVVRTSNGQVRGAMREGVQFFGGIPYAAPPVGPLRWKANAPVRRWTRIRDASTFGADCPQPVLDGKPHPQNENCLTLNVVSPDVRARGLPVLVLVHGGAYQFGSGRESLDHGFPSIVRDGVVIVSPNYRLGRLGFFAHPGLVTEAPSAHSNYWLTDQVAALRWVRDNARRFGGDPAKVTIMGCSAGGSSINALLATPMARGLFARASVHSGGGMLNNLSLVEAERDGEGFAHRVGVKGEGSEAVSALRALSVRQVLAGDPGPPAYNAIIDGYWLPEWLSATFAEGKLAKVPIITGSTSNEASVFGLMGLDRKGMEKRFGIDFAKLDTAYGPLDEAELLRQVETDTIFTSSAMGMTALAARAGAPAWSYHFDYVNDARRGTVPGASHCEDMQYWLGSLADPTPRDAAVGAMLKGYLLNFLRSGNPDGNGLPRWDRVEPGTISPLLIREDTRQVQGFRAAQLAPWFLMWERQSGRSLGLAKGQ